MLGIHVTSFPESGDDRCSNLARMTVVHVNDLISIWKSSTHSTEAFSSWILRGMIVLGPGLDHFHILKNNVDCPFIVASICCSSCWLLFKYATTDLILKFVFAGISSFLSLSSNRFHNARPSPLNSLLLFAIFRRAGRA